MDSIFSKLKDEITQIEYKNYISQLTFNEKYSRQDRLVFNAPNVILANWIKTKYAKKIAQIYENEKGIKPEIIIETYQKDKIKNEYSQKNKSVIQKRIYNTTNLNPTFTFNSFIIGNSNHFAVQVAKAVVQNQGKIYNPLVIYGNTGLGKTHLLNAIGNANVDIGKNVIYTTSEQFLNDYLSNIRNNSMDRFREKYRACDYLLIDDIQFLSGKDGLQEEFFHTFNELRNNNKQIVLTSDKPPKDIDSLEERLKTRFTSGLLADIKPPELETKINIIRTKCELDGIVLNNEVINYIAANINENVREIEGVLVKLNFTISIIGIQDISIDFVKNILKEYIKESKENVELEDILNAVAKYYNIKPSDIKSQKRTQNIVTARDAVIYLARNLTPNSMPSLATFFGMKNHSTISKAMQRIEQNMKKNPTFEIAMEELKNKIK